MSVLMHFLKQFGINDFKPHGNVIILDDKYYLVSKEVESILSPKHKPFFMGTYLGRERKRLYFPSVSLLNIIKNKAKNKVILKEKGEWLFVCGRDIFGDAIQATKGNVDKESIVMVLNKFDEVLGFGKVTAKITSEGEVVLNILDIGDFLRRERKKVFRNPHRRNEEKNLNKAKKYDKFESFNKENKRRKR